MAKLEGRTIYVDMDGVLSDFVSSALMLWIRHEGAVQAVINAWPRGKMNIDSILRITEEEFWSVIHREGHEFWSEMKPYHWAIPLINNVKVYGSPCILSAPARGGTSAHGKIIWLEKHLSLMCRDFILTPRKHKCRLSRPGDILIDDHPQTCKEWDKAGGTSILFPAPWNQSEHVERPFEYTVERLKEICKTPRER